MNDTEKLKDIFEILIKSKVHSSQVPNFIKQTFGDTLTHAELIAIGQILKAENERDTRAAEFIRDTMGQKPTDKQEISGSKDNPFIVKLDDKLSELAK